MRHDHTSPGRRPRLQMPYPLAWARPTTRGCGPSSRTPAFARRAAFGRMQSGKGCRAASSVSCRAKCFAAATSSTITSGLRSDACTATACCCCCCWCCCCCCCAGRFSRSVAEVADEHAPVQGQDTATGLGKMRTSPAATASRHLGGAQPGPDGASMRPARQVAPSRRRVHHWSSRHDASTAGRYPTRRLWHLTWPPTVQRGARLGPTIARPRGNRPSPTDRVAVRRARCLLQGRAPNRSGIMLLGNIAATPGVTAIRGATAPRPTLFLPAQK